MIRANVLLAAVDLAAHHCDGALVDRSCVPGLDGCEIRFSGLIPRTCPPTMGFEEVRGRTQRVGGDIEIAGAVGEDVLGHELRLADLAVPGAARARREPAAIAQAAR